MMSRVYLPGEALAHLIAGSPNAVGVESLCGRSAFPDYWHGTGTQDEHEIAAGLRQCAGCLAAAAVPQRGGLSDRRRPW